MSSESPDLTIFDEEWYLRNNPDVVAAIARGDWKTGKDHYEFYGKKEGRRGNENMPKSIAVTAEPSALQTTKKRTALNRILRSTPK